MSFATGPWHTPPLLPDDPEVLCLVLIFQRGEHHRYEVLRYAQGWVRQTGEALPAEAVVSRWAYVTASVERMSELPEPPTPPVESRLFVPNAHTDAERAVLLAAYVTELKGQLERLRKQVVHMLTDGSASASKSGALRARENELTAQLASRDKRIDEQRAKLIHLHEAVQKLNAALAKRPTSEAVQARSAQQERQLAEQRQQIHTLKQALERALLQHKAATERATADQAARDRKIREQRKALVELEGAYTRLKERLQRSGAVDESML